MAGLNRPLTVTAHLQQGIVLDTGYGVALDGLLASVIRDRGKANQGLPGSLYDGGLAATAPALVHLPLAPCLLPRQQAPTDHPADHSAGNLADPPLAHDGDWHWAATTAYPHHQGDTTGDPDVHHVHTRINERIVETAATRIPASLSPASGRFRNRRLPVVTTPTTHVTWRAVGDPEAIDDLLTDLPSIGGGRHHGEGTVLKWEVTNDPHGDPIDYAHLHHDHTLGRPVPEPCLHALRHHHPHLITDRVAAVGIRPPFWHPATRRHLHLPLPLTNAAAPAPVEEVH